MVVQTQTYLPFTRKMSYLCLSFSPAAAHHPTQNKRKCDQIINFQPYQLKCPHL